MSDEDDNVRVLIQEGKCMIKNETTYVTTVHGMDSLEAGSEKKLNHESMCRFISSSLKCEGSIEKDTNGTVYRLTGQQGQKFSELLTKMEKLPFHSNPEKLMMNEKQYDNINNQVLMFESNATNDPFFAVSLPPSGVYTAVPWICAKCPTGNMPGVAKAPTGTTSMSMLQEDWEDMVDEQPQIYRDDVMQLSSKHNCLTGKWVIYCKGREVDEIWSGVLSLLGEGKLGYKAQVSTCWCNDTDTDEKNDNRVHVFTHDYTDFVDVARVCEELKSLECLEDKKLFYKMDCYSNLGITNGNPWGLDPNLCDSTQLEPGVRSNGVCKFFDPKKGYGFLKNDEGVEVYVKNYDVLKVGERSLVADEAVAFTAVDDHKSGKKKAILVCSRGGGRPARPARVNTKRRGSETSGEPGSAGRSPMSGNRRLHERKGSNRSTGGSEPNSPADGNWRSERRDSRNENDGGRGSKRPPKPKPINTSKASSDWQVASGGPSSAKEPNSGRWSEDGNSDREEPNSGRGSEPNSGRFAFGDGGGGGWGDDSSEEEDDDKDDSEDEEEDEEESSDEEESEDEPDEPLEAAEPPPPPKPKIAEKTLSKKERAKLEAEAFDKELEAAMSALGEAPTEDKKQDEGEDSAKVGESKVGGDMSAEGGEAASSSSSSSKKKKKKKKKKGSGGGDDGGASAPANNAGGSAVTTTTKTPAALKKLAAKTSLQKKKKAGGGSGKSTAAQLAAREAAKKGKKKKKK